MRPGKDSLIYLSAPYEPQTLALDVRSAILAFDVLSEAGYNVYVPHLNFFLDLFCVRDESFWLQYRLNILAVCDFLLRLPGKSDMADAETAFAVRMGIPTFEGPVSSFLESYGRLGDGDG